MPEIFLDDYFASAERCDQQSCLDSVRPASAFPIGKPWIRHCYSHDELQKTDSQKNIRHGTVSINLRRRTTNMNALIKDKLKDK
jgi:hypothetical protein